MEPFPEMWSINGDWELGAVGQSYFIVRNKLFFSPYSYLCLLFAEVAVFGHEPEVQEWLSHVCVYQQQIKGKRKIKAFLKDS